MMSNSRRRCTLRANCMADIHFAIDQGNTRTKLAFFEGSEMVHREIIEGSDQHEKTLLAIRRLNIAKGILSSVRSDVTAFLALLGAECQVLIEGPALKMPFEMAYETPETLGSDRRANAAAFVAEFGLVNGLIIDCGTCITYSVLQKGCFLGGAISPGIEMRFNALQLYTGRLPKVNPGLEAPEFIGKTTEASIRSGVEGAVIGEVEKMIAQYCSQINDLSVILTGGNMTFFERHLKSPIFARPFYTLYGLNEIFRINTK